MCLIIVKQPKEKLPSEEFITRVWCKNSDGGGIMYVRENSNTVHMTKGFMTRESFLKKIKELNFKENDLVCLHLRKTTAGKTNKYNCHPFIADSQKETIGVIKCKSTNHLFLMHNGTIKDMVNGKKRSDTQHFARKMAAKFSLTSLYESKVLQILIEKFVDQSRLCFLHGEKGLLLLGEWHKHEGLMLSKPASDYDPVKTYSFDLYGTNYFGNNYNKTEVYTNKIPAINADKKENKDMFTQSCKDEQWHECQWCGNYSSTENSVFSKWHKCTICKACVKDYSLTQEDDDIEPLNPPY